MPFLPLGDLPDLGIEPTALVSLALQADSLPSAIRLGIVHQSSCGVSWPEFEEIWLFFLLPFRALSVGYVVLFQVE